MKVLQLIGTLDPRYGGPVEGVRQFAACAVDGDVTVDVATLDSPEFPGLDQFPGNVIALGPAYLNYRYCPRLIPWLRENATAYDAVIVNGIWQYQSLATRRALMGLDIPYFIYPHGALDPWFRRRFPIKHLKKWLYWLVAEYRNMRSARGVLFTTDTERRDARESFLPYRCREELVRYGIAGAPTNSSEQTAAFFDAFPALRDRPFILFLSRLHPKKGCDIAMRAFARTYRAHPDVRLVIAGPDADGWGEQLHELAKTLGIEQQVVWTGMLTEATKWGAYHAAEAFLLPSHSENFGVVVAEALSCSLPVLISDKVNTWREVAQRQAGIVFSDNAEDTAAALTEWQRLSAATRSQMRENARRCFTEAFEIQLGFNDLVTLLRSRAGGVDAD